MRRKAIAVLACVVLALAAGARIPSRAASTQPPPKVPGETALDYGFRFASAIHNDPKDKQKAQYMVVMDYARVGLLDEALERSSSIEGWRRGIALADIAELLAQEGRADEARQALLAADRVRVETPGWEGPRISAHIAQARAALGEVDEARKIADDLATNDPKQYTGRAAATAAAAQASRGDFAGAMETLDRLEGQRDMEIASGRTAGYVELARDGRLDPADRRRALDAARRSADALSPPSKQIAALHTIAEEYRAIGATEAAREAMDQAGRRIEELAEADEFKPVMMANYARLLASAGETERVATLLAAAEADAPKVLNLDQPALYAAIGSSWSAAGNAAETWRLYGKALDSAEALRNPRPRALAVVEICRSLGRAGIEPQDDVRLRLDGLLAGLEPRP